MSYTFSDEVLTSVRDLVVHLTNFEEDSPLFKHVFTHFIAKLDAADSLFYVTQKEIDNSIKSLSDKLLFHSFHKQSADIKKLYEKFMEKSESKEETQTKLCVMKLLFCLSNSPTNYLANLPEDQLSSYTEEEEDIDWGKYLQEGIDRWSPPPAGVDSDGWSEDEDENAFKKCYLANITQAQGFVIATESLDETLQETSSINLRLNALESAQDLETQNRESRKKLIEESVQNGWFNQNSIRMLPESMNVDANIALKWEKHLCELSHGLIEYKANVITEYKIMREIIWQLSGLHNSICFKIAGDRLVPKDDICISSIRPVALRHFLCEFLPYIEMLEEFQEFFEKVSMDNYKSETNSKQPPYTYLSYVSALKCILQPTCRDLLDIEKTIMLQDDNITLLKLAHDMRNLLKPVKTLHKIHKEITQMFSDTDNYVCATTILLKLRQGLTISNSKSEQDIFLTLYLKSLTQYVYIVDKWLSTGSFNDERDEFPIIDNNVVGEVDKQNSKQTQSLSFKAEGQQDWQMEFLARKLPEKLESDGLLDVITSDVIKFGKNVHLLDLLGKLHLLNQCENIGSLHEQFIARVLAAISSCFGDLQQEDVVRESQQDLEIYKFPAFCPDFCKYTTEMDRLDNLVDVSDGFLMLAFEEFFVDKGDDVEEQQEEKEENLYEKISKLTKRTFPIQRTIENCFSDLLKERYSESGKITKNILLGKYQLKQHLLLLAHVFLFKEDFIFPFYRFIFEKIDANANCGNMVWLTSNLQDILMDIHPDHYDKVMVVVKDTWRESHDPLSALNLLKPHYKIEWPVNIIIRHENLIMYKEMFKFIIKIKWALYTLNHLHFNDIESKKRVRKVHKSLRVLRGRLNCLRFGLLNVFSSIQHYVFGYVLHSTYGQFEQDLQDSHDLDTLISAHTRFISNLHRMSARVRDYEEKGCGFHLLGYLVRQLRRMWRNVNNIEERDLYKYERLFAESYRNLSEILTPKDLGLD